MTESSCGNPAEKFQKAVIVEETTIENRPGYKLSFFEPGYVLETKAVSEYSFFKSYSFDYRPILTNYIRSVISSIKGKAFKRQNVQEVVIEFQKDFQTKSKTSEKTVSSFQTSKSSENETKNSIVKVKNQTITTKSYQTGQGQSSISNQLKKFSSNNNLSTGASETSENEIDEEEKKKLESFYREQAMKGYQGVTNGKNNGSD